MKVVGSTMDHVSKRIINVADPTGAQDAATKNYVDTQAGDVIGVASSVDSEVVLFSGTGGKTIKRATGTGIVKVTNGVYQTPLAFASLQVLPTNPAGTASTAGVMMGLGAQATPAKITPTATGKVLITVTGAISNSGAAATTTYVQLYYGTGTAPANGAALVGTGVSALATRGGNANNVNLNVPFSIIGVVTGLAVNTQIWIDTGLIVAGTGTGTISGLTVTAVELP